MDTREIINIISETNFYAAELPLKLLESKNAMNKLLAMMVYKNVMPQDFDNLSSGKESQLATFIKDIDNLRISWLNIKTNDNNQKINELKEKIEKISEKLTTDINLLMKIRLQELMNDNGGNEVRLGNVYYSSADDFSKIHEFWKGCLADNLHYMSYYGRDNVVDNLDNSEQELFRKALANNKFTANGIIDAYKQQQDQLRKDNVQLQKQSYQLGVGDLLKIYLDEDTQNIIPDKIKKLVNNDLKFIKVHHVMEYLIKQGLIGFDFADYISPDPYNLVGEDLFLVRSAINRTNIENDNYRLLNVKGVMRELDLLDDTAITYSYAYSPDILVALADGTDKHYRYLLALMDRVHEKQHYRFILTALEIKIPKPDEVKSILLGISHEWSTFYKEVFSSNDNDLQVEVTRQLLICLEHHVYENLFQELSKDKIFENNLFEGELIVLDNKRLDKIFNNTPDKYLYPDLSFAEGQPILLKLIQNQWYKKNSVNFTIIFEQYFNNDFSKMVHNTDKCGFSNQYIKENIFDYYEEKQNAKYDDIIAISEFLDTDKADNKTYFVSLIDVYLKTDIKFDDKEKAEYGIIYARREVPFRLGGSLSFFLFFYSFFPGRLPTGRNALALSCAADMALKVLLWYAGEKVTSHPNQSGGENNRAEGSSENSTSTSIRGSKAPRKQSSSAVSVSFRGIRNRFLVMMLPSAFGSRWLYASLVSGRLYSSRTISPPDL